MTDDRSLERAARSWLEVGPTEAPERAVEAALLRIDTTPQERDCASRGGSRHDHACPRRRGRRHRRARWSVALSSSFRPGRAVGRRARPVTVADADASHIAIAIAERHLRHRLRSAHCRRAAIRSSHSWAPGVCAWGRLAARKRARRTTRSGSRSPFRMAGQGSRHCHRSDPSRATRHPTERVCSSVVAAGCTRLAAL